MRYMGIDYGTKKVGTALSDDSGAMGFPYKVFGNDARLLDTLISIVSTERIKVIVIGESRNYAGNDNPVALQARGLGDVLGQATGIPVVYEPEMLTTQEARRGFDGVREAGSGRKEVDASAAALILTSYLSHSA